VSLEEECGKVIRIYAYTRKQAVEDGVLVELGKIGRVPVYATSNCFRRAGLDNPLQRHGVIMEALAALCKPGPEDTPERRLRVLHEGLAADYDCLWVILEEDTLTILFPEDY
jgi:hypothetical protein